MKGTKLARDHPVTIIRTQEIRFDGAWLDGPQQLLPVGKGIPKHRAKGQDYSLLK